jgi:hypothetical protein
VAPSRRDRDQRTRRRPAADLDADYEDEYEGAEDEPEPRPARRRAGRSSGGLSAVEAAEAALRQIIAITAKSAEGVTSVQPAENGWIVGVELLEARRVPSSSDTLALYEVELDPNADLVSYRRIQRYPRGRSEAS